MLELVVFAFRLLYPCCFILKHHLLWAGMNRLYSWEQLTKCAPDVRPTVRRGERKEKVLTVRLIRRWRVPTGYTLHVLETT